MNKNSGDDDLIITVRVVPRSSRSEIVGESDGVIKIKIASPPVDGAANAELVKILAKAYGIAKTSVEIVSGQHSRTKLVRLAGAGRKDR
ncbi:MAG TPA: DUF167 domain-containing protein [Pyrinomonadaceae bacterium]|nr:DUF167 domain-containing protein [Pyrinomonadaceae bacterium]